jgi:hypothetical protein
MSDRRRILHRRRPRRPATAAERQQARDVAAYVDARGLADEPMLFAMLLVSSEFPDVSLTTAITGYFFCDLLIDPPARFGGNA